jgi:hypothetical protein
VYHRSPDCDTGFKTTVAPGDGHEDGGGVLSSHPGEYRQLERFVIPPLLGMRPIQCLYRVRLARFPPLQSRSEPPSFILAFQPAARGQTAFRIGLAARDPVRRLSGDCPQGRRARPPVGSHNERLFEGFHPHPGCCRGPAGR